MCSARFQKPIPVMKISVPYRASSQKGKIQGKTYFHHRILNIIENKYKNNKFIDFKILK